MIAFMSICYAAIYWLLFVKLKLIAKSARKLLKFRAIGVTAKDATTARAVKRFAFVGFNMVATITDGKIQFAIRPPHQTVQVVRQ